MSAIALEQLGYLIEIKKNGGGNLNDRGQLSFNNALAVVLNDMTVIPFEAEGVDDWKKGAIAPIWELSTETGMNPIT